MLVQQLHALGARPGGVLLVHTALSKVGSRPRELIEALLAVLGPGGTLVMPSMADDDDAAFDRASTPCRAARITEPHPVDRRRP